MYICKSRSNIKNKRCSKSVDYVRVLFISALGVFMLSLLSQLYVTNGLAVKGKEIVEMQSKRVALEKDISELSLEKSKYASLNYIRTRAQEIGFYNNDTYAIRITPDNSTASIVSSR